MGDALDPAFDPGERHEHQLPASDYARGRLDVALEIRTPAGGLPSQRGETWNDTEAINRHRTMTPSQCAALAIEADRAALRFAEAPRVWDERADVRA